MAGQIIRNTQLLFWYYKNGSGSDIFKERLRNELIKVEKMHIINKIIDGLDFKSLHLYLMKSIDKNEDNFFKCIMNFFDVSGLGVRDIGKVFEAVQNLDSSNNEYFSNNFVIRNFLLIVCDLGIDISMLFNDSRVKSLSKYPKCLETVDITYEQKTNDSKDDKQYSLDIDLFEFYGIEKTHGFEQQMIKTINDWSKIIKKIF